MELNNVFNFDENKSASVSTFVCDRIACDTEVSARRSDFTKDRQWYLLEDFSLPIKWCSVAHNKPFPDNYIDWRNKKNMMFDPRNYSVDSFYTDAHQKKVMKHSFGEDLLNNLHLLPDPLKKNLADSIITLDEQRINKTFLNEETVDSHYDQVEIPASPPEQPQMAPFSGITNFFSGVMNVITGGMFHWRPRSPPKYYDCFDESNVDHQRSPAAWQASNSEDQNKNQRAHGLISNAQTELNSDMNKDCKSAAAQCEDKVNKVRLLLSTKSVDTPPQKYRSRRPRKVFVEPGSVEESFEDAFTPEDFVSLSNDTFVEYFSPYQLHREDLLQTDSPRMITKVGLLPETTEIVGTLPVLEDSNVNCTAVKSDNLICESVKNDCDSVKSETNCKIVENSIVIANQKSVTNLETKKDDKENICNVSNTTNAAPVENGNDELVSSCEDKLSQLKALLLERRKKNAKATVTSANSAPELEVPTNDNVQKQSKTVHTEQSQDKRFKNPCRRTDKRRKTRLRKCITDDLVFAHEINSEDLSSVDNSPSMNSLDRHIAERLPKTARNCKRFSDTAVANTPPSPKGKEYFDEISGKFHSTSATDSEDSFQIVFNDSPKPESRMRLPSDCDSEDSFIVFEDSPDSCYTSHDVFGEDSDEDSEYTDSDSDVSDSGCVSKLAPSLSRTISDLTDTSLYEEKCVDEVDCAVSSVCEEIPSEDIVDDGEVCEVKDTGLLLTEAKKQLRKDQPPKKVQFSSKPPEVHVMRVWAFAARQARVGHWERCALDRDRFKRRIADVDMAVSWVLKPQHRSRVMFQRFMPWWNQLKRKEIAERKQKKEEEERREQERLAEEAKKEEESKSDEGNVDSVADENTSVNNHDDNDASKSDGVSETDIPDKDGLSDSSKIVCNGDFPNNTSKGQVKNVAPNKVNVCKSNKNKLNKTEIKEPKCDIKTKSKIKGKIVTKNGTIIVNTRKANGLLKGVFGKEKMVNGNAKDIKLDLKETISGT